MVVGKGDISSVIIDKEEITFFASGVSNSKCSNPAQFSRERNLLFKMPRNQHLVYFSSLAIYYGFSPYISHKRRMEQLVKDLFDSYTIVRIGNISWGNNPNTLINYLKAHPEAEVQKVYRHIIDKDEFQYWLSMIQPKTRNEMNVPGRFVWVPDLMRELHSPYRIKADWHYRDLNNPQHTSA